MAKMPAERWRHMPTSAALKFRRAQHQTRDHAEIHLLARIVQLRLQHLWTVQLLLEGLDGRRRSLPAKKDLHRAIERGLWFGGRIDAQERCHITACAAHFVS